MAKKTISQALKDLFLGLGGNESALADNTSASDYIQDLESAIKATASGAVGDIINDEEASDTTTYSSNKIASLTDNNYLKARVSGTEADTLTFVFPDGYNRSTFIENATEKPSIVTIAVYTDNYAHMFQGVLSYLSSTGVNSNAYYRGLVIDNMTGKLYEVTLVIDKSDTSKDNFSYKEVTTT